MEKGGISNIVSTVLTILLIVVAVGVIAAVSNKVMRNLSENIDIGTSQIALSVLQKTVLVAEGSNNQKYVYFGVQRNPGEGELTGINVVVYDDNGKTFSQQVDGGVGVYESKIIGISLPSDFGKVNKINVYPKSKTTSNKEFIGNVPAVYNNNNPNLAIAKDVSISSYLA